MCVYVCAIICNMSTHDVVSISITKLGIKTNFYLLFCSIYFCYQKNVSWFSRHETFAIFQKFLLLLALRLSI